MTELKPCPFCGHDAVIETFQTRKGWDAVVRCLGCLGYMGSITYDTEKEAEEAVAEAWNRRTHENR